MYQTTLTSPDCTALVFDQMRRAPHSFAHQRLSEQVLLRAVLSATAPDNCQASKGLLAQVVATGIQCIESRSGILFRSDLALRATFSDDSVPLLSAVGSAVLWNDRRYAQSAVMAAGKLLLSLVAENDFSNTRLVRFAEDFSTLVDSTLLVRLRDALLSATHEIANPSPTVITPPFLIQPVFGFGTPATASFHGEHANSLGELDKYRLNLLKFFIRCLEGKQATPVSVIRAEILAWGILQCGKLIHPELKAFPPLSSGTFPDACALGNLIKGQELSFEDKRNMERGAIALGLARDSKPEYWQQRMFDSIEGRPSSPKSFAVARFRSFLMGTQRASSPSIAFICDREVLNLHRALRISQEHPGLNLTTVVVPANNLDDVIPRVVNGTHTFSVSGWGVRAPAEQGAVDFAYDDGVSNFQLRHARWDVEEARKDPAYREKFSRALLEKLLASGARFVVTSNFMRVLSPCVAEAFSGRIYNIHPSYLPALPGERIEYKTSVLNNLAHHNGFTIHELVPRLDKGGTVFQLRVALSPHKLPLDERPSPDDREHPYNVAREEDNRRNIIQAQSFWVPQVLHLLALELPKYRIYDADAYAAEGRPDFMQTLDYWVACMAEYEHFKAAHGNRRDFVTWHKYDRIPYERILFEIPQGLATAEAILQAPVSTFAPRLPDIRVESDGKLKVMSKGMDGFQFMIDLIELIHGRQELKKFHIEQDTKDGSYWVDLTPLGGKPDDFVQMLREIGLTVDAGPFRVSAPRRNPVST